MVECLFNRHRALASQSSVWTEWGTMKREKERGKSGIVAQPVTSAEGLRVQSAWAI